MGLPTKSYVSVEKVNPDGTTSMSFKHVESQIGAVEAEEVGVEHLLRDIHDTSVSTLATRVQQKVTVRFFDFFFPLLLLKLPK